MILKKLFYKLTSREKYLTYKSNLLNADKIKKLKSGLEGEVVKIQQNLKKKEISFLHSGHLGDVINALPVIKEVSKNHVCNLYLQTKKLLPTKVIGYKHPGDKVYMSEKMVDMVIPLLKEQKYLNIVEKFNNQTVDVDLDLFRKIPMNFNLDEVRWYFHLTGVHTDLSNPYIEVKNHQKIKDKVVIMRSTRRKNIFINYKFINNYKDILFIGLEEEYLDLKKEIPNLEFYDCKNFLEAAEIIKSSKFFIGNSSFGFTIAEGLKIPRLMESFPEFPVIYPNGGLGYDFYFQVHFEHLFKKLYNFEKI
jgi:hypothetical protein|tara:strand:- start:140 stop:1057 length:918 start_codon:yes stop_codon:yes gene_type:complete